MSTILPITSSKTSMESVWTIPSIINGLEECHPSWDIYTPKCEPFWSYASKMNGFQTVYSACRGVTLALEKGKPAVVFVPNR